LDLSAYIGSHNVDINISYQRSKISDEVASSISKAFIRVIGSLPRAEDQPVQTLVTAEARKPNVIPDRSLNGQSPPQAIYSREQWKLDAAMIIKIWEEVEDDELPHLAKTICKMDFRQAKAVLRNLDPTAREAHLDKATRDIFGEGSIVETAEGFTTLLNRFKKGPSEEPANDGHGFQNVSEPKKSTATTKTVTEATTINGDSSRTVNGNVPESFNAEARKSLDGIQTEAKLKEAAKKTQTGIQSHKKQPSNDLEREIQAVWAEVLGHPISDIGVDDSFMSFGGDSIAAMQIASQCRKRGIKLPVSLVLQKRTIVAIAPHCAQAAAESMGRQTSERTTETRFNLSPIQKRYLELESATESGWTKFNQSMLCRINADTSAQQLREAFDLIVGRHGMLHCRFSRDSSGKWEQQIPPLQKGQYRFAQHSLDDADRREILPKIEESADSLNIVRGPVFSVDAFDILGQDGMLFLVAHHLVINIVSWQVVLRELEDFIKLGKLYGLSNFTFHEWCRTQELEATSELSALSSAEQVLPTPVPPSQFDYWGKPDNIFQHLIEESFELPLAVTDFVLASSGETLGATPLEALLGPLLLSFSQTFTDRGVPSVFIEGHGRDPCGDDSIEPSQLVGWFTSMYPMHAPITASMTSFEAIRLVKDTRRRVPRNGRSYFAYRHLNKDGETKFSGHDPIEVLLNYTGVNRQFEKPDAVVKLESRVDATVSNTGPETHRLAMIDIEISVSHGVVTVHFVLNKNMAHLDQVQGWIKTYKELLSQAATQSVGHVSTPSLSSFPLLNITYEQLDTILNQDLPRLGMDVNDVEDILPITAFQKFSLEGHRAVPPRQWDCLFFDIPGGVDHMRLQQMCSQIVQQAPILRTVFVKHVDSFLGVVLHTLEPRVDIFESKIDDPMFMERLFGQDFKQLPSLGSSLLRFMIMRTPTQYRLLLRISHAQDDGFSRGIMVRAISELYNDQKIPEPISFAKYVRHVQEHHEDGLKYWRTVLANAPLSTVLDIKPHLETKRSDTLRSEKMIPPLPSMEEFTSATIFNAACALLLQSLTKSHDVIFGRITSGRAGLDPELQYLMGPCANIIPTRVRLQENFRPSDALQLVHQQYLDSIEHETVGLDDIIRECTDWSTSMSRFPVITQHINQQKGYEVPSVSGGIFKGGIWEPPDEDPFPWSLCLGAFPSDEGVRISLAANSLHLDQQSLDKMRDSLCEIISEVTRDANL